LPKRGNEGGALPKRGNKGESFAKEEQKRRRAEAQLTSGLIISNKGGEREGLCQRGEIREGKEF